jgi:hypothetical protein
MSAEPPLAVVVVIVVVSVLCFGVLAVFSVLVIRDTIRRHGQYGINFKQAVCIQCATPLPGMRVPTNWYQAAWDGWTCTQCRFELDKWGRPAEVQKKLSKWAFHRPPRKPASASTGSSTRTNESKK